MTSNNVGNDQITDDLEAPLQTGLIVLHALTAEIKKEKSTIGFRLGLDWNLENDIAQQFIQSIETKFKRRNKLYSYLAPKEADGSESESIKMASRLNSYLTKDTPETSDFRTLVKDSMTALTLAANERNGRFTPSNVVFVHYKRDVDDIGRILFVMLKQKGIYKFDENLLPVEEESIDTDALLQAASIDATLFKTIYPKNNGEHYLSFIKGDSSSDFFQQALGCNVIANNLESNKALNEGLRAFVSTELAELTLAAKDNIFLAIEGYLDEVAKAKTEQRKIAHLNEIQAKIDSLIPDKHANKRGTFRTFLNENEFKVNESFSPTSNGNNLARRVTFEDNAKNYKCAVVFTSIGSFDSDKPVKLTEDCNYIMIPVNEVLTDSQIEAITQSEQ